jgi:hypothetical protein
MVTGVCQVMSAAVAVAASRLTMDAQITIDFIFGLKCGFFGGCGLRSGLYPAKTWVTSFQAGCIWILSGMRSSF